MNGDSPSNRRPIGARSSRWAIRSAAWLARHGAAPNLISALSVLSALLAAACLVIGGRAPLVPHVILWLLAGGFIQLRLLCNLLDGMVAIEGGRQTKSGPVFNELPDRISDAVILIGAGYATPVLGWIAGLGWCAALLAVLIAYVRALAGSLGARQDFRGPMAKQQRMEVMTAACLLGALLAGWHVDQWAIAAGLAAVIAGGMLTVGRRSLRLVRELELR